MTITATATQALILSKVGDIDPDTGDPLDYGASSITGLVGQNMAPLWAAHEDKAQITPRLRELYVERDAYDLLIGALGALVDYTLEGEAIRLNQRIQTLQTRWKNVDAQITALTKWALARRGPAIGQLVTTAPVSPPVTVPFHPFGPDANDSRYGGSPYGPFRRNVY